MDELKQLSVKFVADINEFTKSVNQIKQDLKSVSKTPVSSANLSKFVNQSTKGASTFNKNITSMTKSVLGFNKSLNAMARFGRFLVFSYLGRQLVNMTQNMLEAGASMVETQNLFQVAFEGMADQAEEFANKLERAWGVSATLTKQQTAYLDNMFKSMGATEEMAYGMSTGLVQLSHNIASLYDIDQQTAYEKLRSAMVGVSRPLLQLGINTKVAQLQQTAFEHGITSTNRELTQQEKLLATYWAIYDQTKSAWASGTAIVNGQVVAIGDMTKTIMTNANMTRVLSNRLKDLSRWWGLAFQPVVEFVLPILYTLINALINVGKSFALFMGNLFGGNYKTVEEMLGSYDDGSAAFTYDDGLIDYLDETEKGANKASKTLSKLTGGIDELNILSQDSGSGSGGGFDVAGGGIENDIGLPTMDYILEDVISQGVAERIEQIKKALLTLIDPLKEVAKGMLGAFAVAGVVAGIAALITAFKKISSVAAAAALSFNLTNSPMMAFKAGLEEIGKIILTTLSSINLLAVSIAAFIAIFVAGFVYLMATSEEFRNNILEFINEIWQAFVDLGDSIYKNFIEPIIAVFADFVKTIWDSGLAVLVENISYFVAEAILLITTLLNWFSTNILPIIVSTVDLILEILKPILIFIIDQIDNIVTVLRGVINFITGIFSDDWEKAWSGVVQIFSGLWNSLVGIVSQIWNSILSLFGQGGQIFNGIVGAIGDVFKKIVNALLDGLNKIIAVPFATINGLLNTIKDIDIPLIGKPFYGLWGYNPLPVPQIPKLASGGIAYGETMAMVGEYANARNNPEVIAPLDKLQGMINNMSDEETNLLLREQNDLLRALLEKDTSVKIDGRSLNRALDKSKTKMGYAIMG